MRQMDELEFEPVQKEWITRQAMLLAVLAAIFMAFILIFTGMTTGDWGLAALKSVFAPVFLCAHLGLCLIFSVLPHERASVRAAAIAAGALLFASFMVVAQISPAVSLDGAGFSFLLNLATMAGLLALTDFWTKGLWIKRFLVLARPV